MEVAWCETARQEANEQKQRSANSHRILFQTGVLGDQQAYNHYNNNNNNIDRYKGYLGVWGRWMDSWIDLSINAHEKSRRHTMGLARQYRMPMLLLSLLSSWLARY